MSTTDIFKYTAPDDSMLLRNGAAAMRNMAAQFDINQGYGTCLMLPAASLPSVPSNTSGTGLNVFSLTPQITGPVAWSPSVGGVRVTDRNWMVWAYFSLQYASNATGHRNASLGTYDGSTWVPLSRSGQTLPSNANGFSTILQGGRLLTLTPGIALGIFGWQNSGASLPITDATLNVIAVRPA